MNNVTLVSHKARQELKWHEVLDKTVMKRWPDIICVTVPTRRGYETKVVRIDGKRIMPRLRRALEMYVKGWMDNEEGY